MIISFYANCQTRELDSLKHLFTITQQDSIKAAIYVEFSEQLYFSKPDTIIPLCEKAIQICDKNLNNPANIFKNKFKLLKANALNNIGVINQERNNISVALDYYFKSVKLLEEIKDQKYLGQTYNNIAFLYQNLDDPSIAFQYYEKGLALRTQMNDSSGIAQTLNNIGLMYRKFGDPNCKSKIKEVCRKSGNQLALEYYLKSLDIYEKINERGGISTEINNIGSIYRVLGDYDKALEYFTRSLKLREEINDERGIGIALNNMGGVFGDLKQFDRAEEYSLKSLAIARKLNNIESLRRASEVLYRIYNESKQYEKALNMFRLFISSRDSLTKQETINNARNQFYKTEYEKKALADSIRVEQEKNVVALQLENKKNQSYYLIAGLILVLIFLGFMYNRFKITQNQKKLIEIKEKETQSQKVLIEGKQKEIVDSITYAQRIQKALLASDDLLQSNLPSHFVFYQPKDIVSGDFYWATSIATNEKASFYLAVCDSTGHGVPGAFMSLLNISYLNEAVLSQKINQTSFILDHVRAKIIQNLSYEGAKDGMDCCLVEFDFNKLLINYSAAHNHIWVVRNGSILQLETDKMPVGQYEGNNKSFSQFTFQMERGDCIYLGTDGFADQFGGPKGKKFMKKQLQQLILNSNHLEISQQKEVITTAFNKWKGAHEQVDDVCLIGIKVE